MRHLKQVVLGWLVIGIVMGLALAPASATNFTVSSATYTKSDAVGLSDPFDTHELTAQSGQRVKYTMTTTSGCAMLFFVKGHSADESSQYYVVYSQENCVASYSNEFPVASSDGTQFTVLILRTASPDSNYTVAIETFTPAIPSWAVGLLVVIAIIVVLAVVRTVIRRRKARAAPPPMQPPQMPPQAP